MSKLILGPILRHVGERTASVWVETDRPGTVAVVAGGRPDATARTFTVHGHHYALVELDGLPAGSETPYEVTLDGERVWPAAATGRDGSDLAAAAAALPPSRIRTLPPDGTQVRLAFGSCRHPGTPSSHGYDALAAYARRLSRTAAAANSTDANATAATDATAATNTTDATNATNPTNATKAVNAAVSVEWPTALLLVGDQVYADRPPNELKAIAAGRRDLDEPPYEEVADFEEYAQLYRLAWSTDRDVRWLLSTVPTFMIFDDHDIRDDWNTSQTWRDEIRATPWWRQRIIGGLGAYWIYQHLGNLGPAERAADPLYAALRAADGDAGSILDEFADQTDQDPSTTRWSYACDLGRTRLLAVDSRCGRVLDADHRAMLDDAEMTWVDQRINGGDTDHLLIASSLPYLLPAAIHHGEAWNEAACRGVWGRWLVPLAERLRRGYDLEHWAAFRDSFAALASGVVSAARGERGAAPASVTFLSGDVHFSYLARVVGPATETAISQVVCSPLRNPLGWRIRWTNRIAAWRVMGPPARLVAKLAGVPAPPLRWRLEDGLWFQNAIATLEVMGRRARVRWETPVQVESAERVDSAGPVVSAGPVEVVELVESAELVELARAELTRSVAP